MKSLVGFLALLVLGFSGLFVWSQQQHERELMRLQRQVEAVANAVQSQSARAAANAAAEQSVLDEIFRLRAEEPRAPAPLVQAVPALPQDSQSTEPPPGAGAPRPEMTSQELFQHIEESFHLEGVDSTWSKNTERELRDRLATQLTQGASLRSMNCHASLCRLEVQYPGEHQASAFMNPLTQTEPFWKGAMMTHRTEGSDSGTVLVSYLAREGHELPLPAGLDSPRSMGHGAP